MFENDNPEIEKHDNVIEFSSYNPDRSADGEADKAEQEIKAAVRRLKFRKLIIILMIGAVLSGSVFVYYLYTENRKYISADIKYSRLKSEVFAGYTDLGDRLVRYGKDGAILIDKNGRETFNSGYNMKNPIADTCGKYLAIADLGGNSACLFDSNKELCAVTSAFPIVGLRTSNTGVLMLVSEDEEKTYMDFYYKDGKKLAESQHPLSKGRFPICFDLSFNGLQAAIGFMGYDKTELLSTLAVLGFDQVGETKPNNVIFSYDVGEEQPLVLEYNSKGDLLMITEKGFRVFKADGREETPVEVQFEGKPRSVLYNDDYIVYILKEDEAKLIHFYDYSGTLLQKLNLLIDYQKVLLNRDLLVMAREDELIAYDTKGRLRIEYIANGRIKDIKAMDNRLSYLVVYDGKMEFIEFK